MSSFSVAEAATAFIADVWNAPDGVASLDEWLAPDYRDHAYDGDRQGLAKAIGEVRRAFPDARFEVEDVLASGNEAALRLKLRGTHSGSFRDLEATGREVEVKVFRWLRFDDHRVAEHWALLDTASLLRQLNA